MEEIIRILEEIKPGVDYRREQNLFEDHLLASLEIMMLVSELNDAFDITVTLPYIKPENFRSAETIYAMVQKIQDED
jgi:D-alanine--poly(phosphoribitol) ligase subunit 2